LIDGTYELFRAFYGAPSSLTDDKREVGATRALLRSFTSFIRDEQRADGAAYVAVAFDTVIESFRNQLFTGYKTGEGIDPALFSQFPLIERATRALGMVTWSMIDFETDDALATGAARYAQDPRVTQVRITSPDKDFCQCVRGDRVVMYERKSGKITDEAGALQRLGVMPAQVPAWLALVGDSADGIPGIARWGEKSAATVLNHYRTIDAIPDDASTWSVKVRGKDALAASLASSRADAKLYETLATLRTDVPLTESLDDLKWRGARMSELRALCEELGANDVLERLPVPSETA
jgi:5'-3' exonuclease